MAGVQPPRPETEYQETTPESYKRIEPAHISQPINIVSAVIVPLLQTIITAVLAALFVPAIHWVLLEYTDLYFPALPIFFLVLLVALLYQWLTLLGEWRALLWPEPLEEVFTNPQMPQAQNPITESIKIQITSPDRKTSSFLELPISQAKLGVFAIGVSNGGTTAESAWVGTSQLFNRAEYSSLRDALITRGFARWNSENHQERGWRLTEKGKAIFKELSLRYNNPLRE